MHASLPLWLNLFSQAVVIFLLTQFSLVLFWLITKHTISTLSHRWQGIILWLVVSLPWLMSIGCFFIPGQLEYFHWHHSFRFSWQSWHGLSLVLSILISLYLITKAVMILKYYQQQDHKRRTLSLLTLNQDGHFQHPQALAFTSGLLQPKVYISTGLAQQLNTQELAMVTLHEQAHVKSYDPLRKWLFLFLASFFPRTIAHQFLNTLSLVMEYGADQTVAKQFDVLDIAETLIKVARLMNSPTGQVQQRLHYLIDARIVGFFTPFALLLLQFTLPLLAVFFAMDFLHHFFDQWLWHFN
jgi:Zn-dependent protease with chaperone function